MRLRAAARRGRRPERRSKNGLCRRTGDLSSRNRAFLASSSMAWNFRSISAEGSGTSISSTARSRGSYSAKRLALFCFLISAFLQLAINAPQFLHGPERPGLDRADAASQDLGDLLILQSLVTAQNQDFPLFPGQEPQGFFYPPRPFLFEEIIVRVFVAADIRLVDSDLVPRALEAVVVVDVGVVGDPEHPGDA